MDVQRRKGRDGTSRWQCRYRGGNGKRRAKTFHSKREAERFLRRVHTDMERGDHRDPDAARQKFAALAAEYVANAHHLKPKTLHGYQQSLTTVLLPVFGGMPVGRITRAAVQDWIDTQAGAFSPNTVRARVNVLRSVLNRAVRKDAIRVNPCQGVRLPAAKSSREIVVLTAAQVHALAEAVGARFDRPALRSRYRTLILVAAYTGLRGGELAALRVRSSDALRARLHVREAVADVGGKLQVGSTKTARQRTVGIPAPLVPLLEAELDGKGPDDLIFPSSRGGLLRMHSFGRTHLRPAVHACARTDDFPRSLRMHDLRHTCASLLIAQGAHPRAIQERLGHSSVTVTMDIYGHLLPSLDDALTDRLGEAIEQAADGGSETGPGPQRTKPATARRGTPA